MIEIKFSKELMAKHAKDVLLRKSQWLEPESIWYRIDWRNKKVRDLKKFYVAGLEEIGENGEFQAKCDFFKGIQSVDGRAVAILRYINRIVTYERDEIRWGVKEYWQSPLETWTLRKGDCEDGALLLGAFWHWSDVPVYQYDIVAGEVVGGGHAYVLYRSMLDGRTYHLDWCYWFSGSSINDRMLFCDDDKYIKVWFGFNSFKSWKVVKKPSDMFM